MFPIAFQFGPIYISTFGLSLAFGFLTASFFIFREAKNNLDIPVETLFDACLIVTIGAIVGARIWYGIFHREAFEDSILLFFLFRERPGLSFPGGLLGATAALWFFCFIRRNSIFQILRFGSTSFLWAYLVGQLGSLLDGFGFGPATSLPLGVSLFGSSLRYHPFPLYQVIFTLLLLLLTRFAGKNRSWFLLMLGFICLFSAVLAFWRSDLPRIGTASVEQIFYVSSGFLLLCLYYFRERSLRRDSTLILAFVVKMGENMARKLTRKAKHEISHN